MNSEVVHRRASPATPGEPRWALSALYALAVTAFVGWAAWPGMMPYDPLYAIEEARSGIHTMIWPPMHAYLFWLSYRLGVGPGGIFLLQEFLLFFGAALSLNLLVKRLAWAIAGLTAFTATFVYVPELMGTVITQWRDVTTTSFAMAGVAAWLLAARKGSAAALAIAAASIGLSLSLRYNAFALFVLILPLMIWSPFLGALSTTRMRGTIFLALIFACGLAWASTQLRLPDFNRLPSPPNVALTQEFDLIGISACADKNYLPPVLTDGRSITPRQIRQIYDPRHSNRALRDVEGAPTIRDVGRVALHAYVSEVWLAVLPREFRCYLAHRSAVMVEQLGLARDDVFIPGYFAVDQNAYGLKAAHPDLMQGVSDYVTARDKPLWRRPAVVLGLAPLALLLIWRRSRTRAIFLALLAGAYAYIGVLFVAAPAADFRYIFPPTVLCCFILAAGGAVFMDSLPQNLPAGSKGATMAGGSDA